MGDWYGTAAMLLAIALFAVGVRWWETRGTATTADTPDSTYPQVNDSVADPGTPSGRGSGRPPEDPLEEGWEDLPEDPRKTLPVGRGGRPVDRPLNSQRPGFGAPEGVRGAWIRVAPRDRSYDGD